MEKHLFGKFVLITLFAIAAGMEPAFGQSTEKESSITTTDRYEFYSNFWINMHHFLYKKGEESEDRQWREVFDPALLNGMSEREREILGNAVAYYRENLIDKDLLFNDQLYWAKRALIKFEAGDVLDHEAVEAGHRQLLNETKNVYAKYFWETHDRQNRKIVSDHIALIRKIENPAFDRMAELARQPWPDEKVRVDVSYYSNWAGAYCTVTPVHAVVTSQTQGPEGSWAQYDWLELVFHEPSHAVIFPGRYAVGTELQKISNELGVEEPRGLWHAILFYFSGITVQELLKAEGIAHELMMVTGDIFSRHHAVVFEHMPAYVQGKASLEEALRGTVRASND